MGEKGKKEIRTAYVRVKDEDTTIPTLPRHARVSRQDPTNRIRERDVSENRIIMMKQYIRVHIFVFFYVGARVVEDRG